LNDVLKNNPSPQAIREHSANALIVWEVACSHLSVHFQVSEFDFPKFAPASLGGLWHFTQVKDHGNNMFFMFTGQLKGSQVSNILAMHIKA
jgi:hypothetical protein